MFAIYADDEASCLMVFLETKWISRMSRGGQNKVEF